MVALLHYRNDDIRVETTPKVESQCGKPPLKVPTGRSPGKGFRKQLETVQEVETPQRERQFQLNLDPILLHKGKNTRNSPTVFSSPEVKRLAPPTLDSRCFQSRACEHKGSKHHTCKP